MKFYSRQRRMPAVIIVSLIDIFAILLIFVIVTTTFRRDQPEVMINLPESKTAAPAATVSDPIVLDIKADNTILLDGEPLGAADAISVEDLSARLKKMKDANRSFALKADDKADFGIVIKILDAFKIAKVPNIPAFTKSSAP